MSGNRWDQPGVPHKGWHCVDVVDLRADGESADETDYATCQMCGNEKIRYVHIMEHPDLDENFDVGCVCAEKMSGDFEGPKLTGSSLPSRAILVRSREYLSSSGVLVGVSARPSSAPLPTTLLTC